MTKTKRQCRAEAVERLKKARSEGKVLLQGSIIEILVEAAGHDYGRTDWEQDMDIIADLLEDDELPKGDAAALLRDWLDYKINRFDAEANAIILNTGAGPDKLYEIADMMERDYVSREAYEDLRDEFTWTNSFLHRVGKQCGTKDVPSLKAYVEQLEAEVAEYEAVDRRIAETDARWEAAIRDLESMTAERDEWKVKADQAQESYLVMKEDRDAWIEIFKDAELRSNDGVVLSNLEWLYMHDSELAGYVDGCVFNKGYVSIDTLQWAHEWLMAPHVDANDVFSGESVVTPEAVDANDGNEVVIGARHATDDEHAAMMEARDALSSPTPFNVLMDDNDICVDESCGQYADQPKREEAPDCESDSREKLEADVRNAVKASSFGFGTIRSANRIIEWLDRQASIDERYWKSQVDALVSKGETITDGNTWLWSEAAELQEKVDEQRKSLEAAWEDNAELIDRVDSLVAENSGLIESRRAAWAAYNRYNAEAVGEIRKLGKERRQLEGDLDGARVSRDKWRERARKAEDAACRLKEQLKEERKYGDVWPRYEDGRVVKPFDKLDGFDGDGVQKFIYTTSAGGSWQLQDAEGHMLNVMPSAVDLSLRTVKRPPLIASDSEPIEIGQTLYGLSDGKAWEVDGFDYSKDWCVIAHSGDVHRELKPRWLTHERPEDGLREMLRDCVLNSMSVGRYLNGMPVLEVDETMLGDWYAEHEGELREKIGGSE